MTSSVEPCPVINYAPITTGPPPVGCMKTPKCLVAPNPIVHMTTSSSNVGEGCWAEVVPYGRPCIKWERVNRHATTRVDSSPLVETLRNVNVP